MDSQITLPADIILYIGQLLADEGDVRTSRLLTTCTVKDEDVVSQGWQITHPVILEYTAPGPWAQLETPEFSVGTTDKPGTWKFKAVFLYSDKEEVVIDSAVPFASKRRVTWFQNEGRRCVVKIWVSSDNPEMTLRMHSEFESNWTTFLTKVISIGDTGIVGLDMLFAGATEFNLPLDHLQTGKVKSMDMMFSGARNFNQPIGSWNTGSVTSMRQMFNEATNFNQPIGSWNTCNVRTMESMFYSAEAFNQSIETWDVSGVRTMDSMFAWATNFNSPLNRWNVSGVATMAVMFLSAVAFKQDISDWNPVECENFASMFRGSDMHYKSPPEVFKRITCWDVEDFGIKDPDDS